MADKADRIKKTVTFTQDTADRLLLETIETLIAQGKFDSFNGLCKQALAELVSRDEAIASGPGLLQFAHQLIELQRQFFEFKETVALDRDRRLGELESQVETLQEQIEQLAEQNTQQVAESTSLSEKSSQPKPPSTTDPLIDRLGGLLEDF